MRASSTSGRAALAAALCAALLRGAPARADGAADVEAARELFIEGSRFAARDLWADARDRFERSLALRRSALTLYSLGVAQRNTGRLVEALDSFRAFLAEPSTPASRPYEVPARDAASALSKRIARMDIRIEPAQARAGKVLLDGVPIPAEALGQARAVNPGKRVVVASATGFRPARVEVVLVEGEHASVRLVLERARLAEDPAAPGPALSGPDAPAGPPAAPSRALPFTLIAGGTAMLAGGAALGLTAVNDASSAPTRDGAAAEGARHLALAGDVLAGVGLATAAAGVIVLAASRPQASATPASIEPWIGLGSAGLRGSF